MEPAESIARLGFSRWYERQLIESHAYLVTGFLCMILMLASLEEFDLRAPGLQPFATLALISGAGLVCYYSCVRYLTMLAHAEHIARKSTCEKCKAYAAFSVTGSWTGHSSSPDEAIQSTFSWFAVKCRKCGHEWIVR
ncbi:MAG TPA: hypothetical protein VLT92_09905 [Burkholderiales bacterium]|nr:hypothetical protein [Burkholderiales bacterium]